MLRRELVGQCGSTGCKNVVDVDLADQRRRDRDALLLVRHFKAQPVEARIDVPRPHHRAAPKAVR